ncbi:SpoIIE family protein phosphatase [Streptomyces sp. NPDC026673]|uniref:SpoIIE family protein phosphatase n=1 Tax=Streptomyces sp. NPDC026673 TaxID=3155724 RepID=UPI003407286B
MRATPDYGAAQPYGSAPSDAAGSAWRAELDRLLDLAVRDVGAHAGAVFLVAPEGRALRLEVTTGMPAEYLAPWFGVGLSTHVPVADAVRERRLVWLGKPQELACRYPRTAIAMPYRFAVAAAPILAGSTAWGALLLFWPCCDVAEPVGAGRERIRAACRSIGRCLQDAADTGRPVTPTAAPRTLSPSPTPDLEPSEALAAAQFAARLPGGSCTLDLDGRFTYVSVAAADLMGGSVPALLGRRPWQALSWSTDPAFEDRFRAAVVSRMPEFFTAVVPPGRWLAFELYPDASGVSVRISPTRPGGTPKTVPAGTVAPRGRPIALGELYQVLHVAAALSEAVGVGDVVDIVAEEMLPTFRAQTLALALFASEDGALRLIGCRGHNPRPAEIVKGARFVSPAAVGTLADGAPSFFPTVEELLRAYPNALRHDELHAWAYLPLIVSGRPIGVCALAFDRPQSFPDNQRTVLTALAGLIAQALERARLYDTNKELAQTLQAAMLPDSLPDLPGLDVAARYLPSVHGMDIGGDFYDLVRVDDTTAAAVIGDVQGHNVTAAGLMGRIRPAIRSHAAAGATPAQALAQANRQLVDLDPGRFVSCLYIRLDLARRRAVLATAGHPPPVLCHPSGHTEVLDVPPGLLLGIDPDADYPSMEIPIEPGMVLALYTDGLVETPGVDLDEAMAGLADRLTGARPRSRSMDRLATDLIDHARQTAPRTDDIALLLIRFVCAL